MLHNKTQVAVWVLAGTLLGVVACKGAPQVKPANPAPKVEEAPPAPAEEPAGPLDKVTVQVNGEALPLRGAAVYHQGSQARWLELSTEPLPCTLYGDAGRAIAEGERYLTVHFTPMLQPDGGSRWQVVNLQGLSRSTGFMKLEGMQLKEVVKEGEVPFALQQEILLPADDFFGHEEMKLSLQGEGVATDCGLWDSGTRPPARPQEAMTVTVAGKTFPIKGATIVRSLNVPHVTLSTGAADCDGGRDAHDVQIHVALEPSFGEDKLHIYMRGDVLPSQYNLSVKRADFKATVDAPVEGGAKGPRQVSLQGSFDASGYQVQLNGQVEALNCLE